MSFGKLVKIFYDFCRDSTIHGLSKVADTSQHVTARIAWLITIVLSFYCASYIIYQSFNGNSIVAKTDKKYSLKLMIPNLT